MATKENICLFGGTFDPIHLGHTHIAAAAVEKFALDRILFLPCRQSPHKLDHHHADASHRLAMCRLAVADFDWAVVDDFDLTAPPPSYSTRTAEAIHQQFPDAQLFWLMGTDQWEALPRWHEPEKLAKLVEFIVFTRNTPPKQREGYRMHSLSGNHPASATTIREDAQNSSPLRWLHPEVATYIHTHHLYKNTTQNPQPSKMKTMQG